MLAGHLEKTIFAVFAHFVKVRDSVVSKVMGLSRQTPEASKEKHHLCLKTVEMYGQRLE